MTPGASGLAGIPAAHWRWLATQRVFFGHQSVGGNIVRGIDDLLRAHPTLPLRLVETGDAAAMREPGLYHARVGTNGDARSKLDEWERTISAAGLDHDAIALLKLCYVDITLETDVAALFAEYERTVTRIRSAHPRLTIVHITTPLTVDPGSLRHHAAKLRRLTSLREMNVPRARYNELMRKRYGGADAIFDLEALESADRAGRRRTVRVAGRDIPHLDRAWTDDGGHLNEGGRTRAAVAFLETLAALAPAR